MTAIDANLIRWARVRGLTEGEMQSARMEGLDTHARDRAARPQDYGFAGNPVDGEALVLEFGGHTIILRQDKLADRPALAPYEVAVWHKEGHMVRLRSGRIVEVDCDRFVVNAGQDVTLNTPTVVVSQALVAQTLTGDQDVIVAGKSTKDHRHKNTQPGTGQSGTMA